MVIIHFFLFVLHGIRQTVCYQITLIYINKEIVKKANKPCNVAIVTRFDPIVFLYSTCVKSYNLIERVIELGFAIATHRK